MKTSAWLMAALLLSTPALAEDVAYKGRTLALDETQASRPILRMTGTKYTIRRDQQELIAKARACLAQTSGATVDAVDQDAGILTASVRVDYGARFSSYVLHSRMDVNIGDGAFQLVQSQFRLENEESGSSALAYNGSGWEKAIESLEKLENSVVDCLYR